MWSMQMNKKRLFPISGFLHILHNSGILRWSRSRISICLFYSLNSLLSKALISAISPPRQHNFTTFQQQYKQWRTSFPLLILFPCTVTADSCSWGKRAVMPEADFFFFIFPFPMTSWIRAKMCCLSFFPRHSPACPLPPAINAAL